MYPGSTGFTGATDALAFAPGVGCHDTTEPGPGFHWSIVPIDTGPISILSSPESKSE
jgi:hypothetical protein